MLPRVKCVCVCGTPTTPNGHYFTDKALAFYSKPCLLSISEAKAGKSHGEFALIE